MYSVSEYWGRGGGECSPSTYSPVVTTEKIRPSPALLPLASPLFYGITHSPLRLGNCAMWSARNSLNVASFIILQIKTLLNIISNIKWQLYLQYHIPNIASKHH